MLHPFCSLIYSVQWLIRYKSGREDVSSLSVQLRTNWAKGYTRQKSFLEQGPPKNTRCQHTRTYQAERKRASFEANLCHLFQPRTKKKSEERRKSSKKCAGDDKAFQSLANLIMCSLYVPKCKNVCLSMWKEKGEKERGESKLVQRQGKLRRVPRERERERERDRERERERERERRRRKG